MKPNRLNDINLGEEIQNFPHSSIFCFTINKVIRKTKHLFDSCTSWRSMIARSLFGQERRANVSVKAKIFVQPIGTAVSIIPREVLAQIPEKRDI